MDNTFLSKQGVPTLLEGYPGLILIKSMIPVTLERKISFPKLGTSVTLIFLILINIFLNYKRLGSVLKLDNQVLLYFTGLTIKLSAISLRSNYGQLLSSHDCRI